GCSWPPRRRRRPGFAPPGPPPIGRRRRRPRGRTEIPEAETHARAPGERVQHEAEVRRRRLFALTIGVGVLSGLLAVGFRAALNAAEQLRALLSAGGPGGDGGWMMAASAVFSATTVGVGVWLVQRFAPDAAGSGIPHVEAVLH